MRLAIFAIVLATAALAVPIIEPDWRSKGAIIPLTKRSPSSNQDDAVDFDALHSHIESINAKILRGFENYERNMEIPHSLAVTGVEPLSFKNRAVDAAPLTNHEKYVWYGTITIGTPQSFTVEIDTGSSDLFLPRLGCSGYLGNNRWDPALSSTAKTKDLTFKLGFDDGATVSGHQYVDNVTITGVTADAQTICAATTYSTDMGFPPDGMLGLAFQPVSSYPASSLFKTLIQEGKVNEPVFSLKLTSDGGELYLGGTNGDLYRGEIIYTPVIEVVAEALDEPGHELMSSSQEYWQVNVQKIRGNHQTILRDITAIIDTGATLILGDPLEVARLYSIIGGKWVGRGYYSFPCNDFPTISSYSGGDTTFRIPTSILNLGPIRPGSSECFGGIIIIRRGRRANHRSPSSEWPGFWSLGSVFLRSVYTVFDFGNQQVGFADLV